MEVRPPHCSLSHPKNFMLFSPALVLSSSPLSHSPSSLFPPRVTLPFYLLPPRPRCVHLPMHTPRGQVRQTWEGCNTTGATHLPYSLPKQRCAFFQSIYEQIKANRVSDKGETIRKKSKPAHIIILNIFLNYFSMKMTMKMI